MSGATPIPAATLILLRDRPDGPPDLLLLERHAGLAFAAGAYVFPGGRVDPADHALGDGPEEVARVAAIRETIEEAGIAVGLVPAPDAAAVARLRAGLAAGTPFAELLAAEGLAIVPDAVRAHSRWCPAFRERRTFDTRFFIARAPADAAVAIDGSECVGFLWAPAATLLAGPTRLIFPTRRTVERVGLFASAAAALEDALRTPVRLVVPRLQNDRLTIPADLGYPVSEAPAREAMRG